MLVAITNQGYGNWDDLVWVNLASASLGRTIYENDIVFLIGRLEGTYSYSNTNGGTSTVPVIDVTQMRLATSKPKTTPTTSKPKTTPTTSKPAPPTVQVIAKAQASGELADATALGDATAFPIEVVITSTPAQSADFVWDLTCDESNGSTGEVDGEKTVQVPVVYHLKAPSGSTGCEVLADVTLNGSGSVTVKIED
jgi:hypothetical protein